MAKTTQIYFFILLDLRNLKWVSLVKIKRSAGLCRGSKRESVFLSFPTSRGCPYSLVYGPILNLQSLQWTVGPFLNPIMLTLLPPPSSPFKGTCGSIMLTQIIMNSLYILSSVFSNLNSFCNLNSTVLYNITYSQVPGMRTGTSLGSHYSAYNAQVQANITIKTESLDY